MRDDLKFKRESLNQQKIAKNTARREQGNNDVKAIKEKYENMYVEELDKIRSEHTAPKKRKKK